MNVLNIETRFRVLFYGFRIVSVLTHIVQGTRYIRKDTTVLRIQYADTSPKGENDTDRSSE